LQDAYPMKTSLRQFTSWTGCRTAAAGDLEVAGLDHTDPDHRNGRRTSPQHASSQNAWNALYRTSLHPWSQRACQPQRRQSQQATP
jgi:hypothetical protein